MWKILSFGSRSTEPTPKTETEDAYAEHMKPSDSDTAYARFINYMTSFSMKHREALGYPIRCHTIPAWVITNNLTRKAKLWMKERYTHGLPMTFREMVTLVFLLDDAMTEAIDIHQEHEGSCCKFWGMDEWNETKMEIETLVTAKFI